MKKVILISVLFLSCFSFPPSPYNEEADAITIIDDGNMRSICYSYGCKDGKYKRIIYEEKLGIFKRRDIISNSCKELIPSKEDFDCYMEMIKK